MKKPRGIRKPKGYDPKDPSKSLFIAAHGKVCGEAAHFFDDCNTLHQVRNDAEVMKQLGVSKKDVATWPAIIGEDIAKHVRDAVETGNGEFFRDMEKLCEQGYSPDTLKQWLIVVHFHAGKGLKPRGKQDEIYSTKDLVCMAEQMGILVAKSQSWETKERTIRRACSELGIKTN